MIMNGRKGRRIFFVGDSLSELGQGPTSRVYEMPILAYNGLTRNYNISMFPFALSGAQLDPDAANTISSQITTVLSIAAANDIAVIFGGTNDISVGGHDETETYADLCTNAQRLRNAGLKVVAVTMIAKNRAADADPAAINVTRLAYNVLVKGGSTFAFDAIADAAALPQFDAVADTADATYYNADAVHLTTAGYTLVAGVVTTAVQSLL